jgi:hypothetical protein
MTDEEVREQYIQGLRDLADWLDAHEEFEINEYMDGCIAINYVQTKEELAERARQFGPGKKFDDTYSIGLERSFGPHGVSLNIGKEQSCERIQVGVKEVTKTYRRGQEPEDAVLVDSAYVAVKEEEPQYDWKCPPSLLRSLSDGEHDDVLADMTEPEREDEEPF